MCGSASLRLLLLDFLCVIGWNDAHIDTDRFATNVTAGDDETQNHEGRWRRQLRDRTLAQTAQ